MKEVTVKKRRTCESRAGNIGRIMCTFDFGVQISKNEKRTADERAKIRQVWGIVEATDFRG